VSAPIIGATKLHHLDDAVAALTIRLADASLGGLHSPKLLIRSGRLREITGILGWDAAADNLNEKAIALERGGC
jgi:hypothetical protein